MFTPMKDYQLDKYENFFLNLKTTPEGLAKFGDFTATAVAAPGIAALVAEHGPALQAALARKIDQVKRNNHRPAYRFEFQNQAQT